MMQAYADDQDELAALQARADEIHRKLVAEGRPDSPDDIEKWVAAGETGYVNCLLTVLGEEPANSVTVSGGQLLPSLSSLAAGNSSLTSWTSKLTFPYGKLSSQAVVAILAKSFELETNAKGRLKTILVKSDLSPLAVLFTAERISGDTIKLTVVRAEHHGKDT